MICLLGEFGELLAQGPHGAMQVNLDGAFGYPERVGDLLVRLSGRDEVQHLLLAGRQSRVPNGAVGLRRIRRLMVDRGRRHEDMAFGYRPQGMFKLRRGTAFGHEAMASSGKHIQYRVPVATVGDHQDFRCRPGLAKPAKAAKH